MRRGLKVYFETLLYEIAWSYGLLVKTPIEIQNSAPYRSHILSFITYLPFIPLPPSLLSPWKQWIKPHLYPWGATVSIVTCVNTKARERHNTHNQTAFCYLYCICYKVPRHLLSNSAIIVHARRQVALPSEFPRSCCSWHGADFTLLYIYIYRERGLGGTGRNNRSQWSYDVKCKLEWTCAEQSKQDNRNLHGVFTFLPINQFHSYPPRHSEPFITVNQESCKLCIFATTDVMRRHTSPSPRREPTSPPSCYFLFNDLTKSDKDADTM
jgi:hypothetical protein